jgi:hypothetical protein
MARNGGLVSNSGVIGMLRDALANKRFHQARLRSYPKIVACSLDYVHVLQEFARNLCRWPLPQCRQPLGQFAP